MVIWIIGLSASGKTTLGRAVYKLIKHHHPETVFIDGDDFREIMGNDLGHTLEDRWQNAQRISRLCAHLDIQGINVVCAVLSIFHESQQWNREHLGSYREIYVEASMDTLKKRDRKGIYERALKGEVRNVVGVDIEFKPPLSPDMVVNNDRNRTDIDYMARQCLDELGVDIGTGYRYSQGNRLLQPEKYEYTEYQGSAFLDSYLSSRNQTIKWLTDWVTRIEASYAVNGSAHPWTAPLGLPKAASFALNQELPEPSSDNSGGGSLDSKILLTQAVDMALRSDPSLDVDTVSKLVRRFEVSKRIHQTYRPDDMKPCGDPSNDLALYGLFGILLAAVYPSSAPTKQLVLLNALLKTNDILGSAKGDYRSPAEVYLALASLRMELDIYEELRIEKLA